MTIFRHEWRQGRLLFGVWTIAMSAFLMICMLMFPEMKEQMESVSRIFSAMGAFTAAFGMDKLNFGEAMGFYGVECGNIVGIGGALFAALVGIASLASEEKNHTVEFLLTHPVTRNRVVASKFLAILTQLLVMNALLAITSAVSFRLIGEPLRVREFLLLHFAYTLAQIEIAAICFCISAFLKRGGMGAGIGIAVGFYFLNLFANISKSALFLRWLTPFGYAEASDILTQGTLDWRLVCVGLLVTLCAVVIGFWQYGRKDIAA